MIKIIILRDGTQTSSQCIDHKPSLKREISEDQVSDERARDGDIETAMRLLNDLRGQNRILKNLVRVLNYQGKVPIIHRVYPARVVDNLLFQIETHSSYLERVLFRHLERIGSNKK